MRLSRSGFAALLVAGAGALGLALVVSLGTGAATVGLGAAVEVLARRVLGLGAGGEPLADQIVWGLRLPRVIGGAVAGGVLSVVGASLQAVMKNPLADPYILGISSGASVGAALAVIAGSQQLGGPASSSLAFATALLSAAGVYRVAAVGGIVPPIRLLLAGIAWSSFATAITGFLLYLAPEATQVRGVVFWLMGGLASADWPGAIFTAAVALPAAVVLFATARWQNLLLLGDESALSLGLDTERARRWLIAICALATGALVAFAGAIGFVGLVVPHALRPFTGPDHRRLIPAAFLFGGALLVGMDALARVVVAPEELPVGILCGLLGAPFFFVLLRRTRSEVEP